VALGGQGGGQVDSHRGLADAALARGDREHPGGGVVAPEGDLLGGLPAAETRHHRLALLVGHHAEVDVHAPDAGQGRDGGGDVLGDAVLQRAAWHREQDRDLHHAVVADDHVGDHVEFGDGPVDLGVLHLGEGAEDLVASDHGIVHL
jgi:hypothetical protein